MTSPVLALRAAIRAACLADPALAALMDPRIHDEPPRDAAPVYATFGEGEVRDASTSTERSHEQEAAILVWAAPGSAAGALAGASRLASLLDDAPLALAGHRLVSLGVTAVASGTEEGTTRGRVALRLRAVTEALC